MERMLSDPSLSLPALDALEELLSRETQTYQRVVEVMKEKSRFLCEGNYHQLPQCDQSLAGLAQTGVHLETERMGLMQNIATKEMSLQQLIYQLPSEGLEAERKERLVQARSRLMEVVESVNLLNQDHRRMIHGASKWISTTLSLVSSHSNPEPSSYQSQGGKVMNRKPHGSNPTQSTVVRDA